MLDTLTVMNPWWEGLPVPLPQPLLARHALEGVRQHLGQPQASIITGPRQVGKTVLVRTLIRDLLSDGVAPQDVLYMNLDARVLWSLFETPARMPELLTARGWDRRRRTYVFIDEVQRLSEPGLAIKALIDLGLPIKLVLTGSSQLELRARVSEHLTGRSRRFQLFALSYEEIAAQRFSLSPEASGYWAIRSLAGQEADALASEILTFGGYPAVVTAPNEREKRLILQDLIETYVQRDVGELLGVENLTAFMNLMRALAAQTGSLVNLSELSGTLSLAWETVRGYLDTLEATFVVFRLRPFFGATSRKELRKMPKLHFMDTGIRNALLADFSASPFRADLGALVETAFASRRFAARYGDAALSYWRTQAGTEVDLVESLPDGGLIAYEVKTRATGRFPRALRSFAGEYPSTRCVELRALHVPEARERREGEVDVRVDHVLG
jgi:uncharacterized protein